MSENDTITEYKGITNNRLQELLTEISNKKIGFIGDMCIDIYWYADMTKSELSRETPHFPLPIVEERYQLGAGGNVVANLVALNPKSISAIGVIGDDWRGMLVKKCLDSIHVDTDKMIEIKNHTTNAYCKPMRKGISNVIYEDPRLDFTGNKIAVEYEEKIVESFNNMASRVDIICVSDQFMNGCISKKVRDAIAEVGKKIQVIVDSRDRIAEYRNVIIKPNEVESIKDACKLCNCDEKIFLDKGLLGFAEAGRILNEKLNCNVSMTLGNQGNMQIYNQRAIHVLPRDIKGPIDFCGAGDTFLSAYTCALAAGAAREEAGQIAGMASEVTICKTNQTGTATKEEITNRFKDAYAAE
jgi:rfaE bifunctional protein kinase chain/domain